MLSPDARVALRPEATYLELIAEPSPPSWQALGRPVLVVLVIAVGLTVAAVHQITLKLVLTTAAAWSATVAIQIAIGAGLIASAPSRRVGFVRAVDLWFAGHLPYSLWILGLPLIAALPLATPHELMVFSIVIPLVWTTTIVTAFCRVVLGLTAAAARWRSAVHLLLVLILGSALVVWAAGGPMAIISYVLRRLTAS
jgi:hypothetical protein